MTEALIRPLRADHRHGGIPIVAAPPMTEAPLWVSAHRDALLAEVRDTGAVLIRGLGVAGPEAAADVTRAVLGEPMVEREPFVPRPRLPGGLYPSTPWPADQPMCMHHELSYGTEMPALLAFTCLTAPATGGATALADAAAVLRDLPAALVARFAAGWQLRRTYNELIGVSWQEAFGTGDRSEVERWCAGQAITVRWTAGGLHTRRVRPAVRRHPETGEAVWCNQIAFLNEWTMDPAVRSYLIAEFGPDGLPFTTLDGGGRALDRATVDVINEVYARHTVREPWQSGDVLLVDNIRMAHSREPYTGDRVVLAALGAPTTL